MSEIFWHPVTAASRAPRFPTTWPRHDGLSGREWITDQSVGCARYASFTITVSIQVPCDGVFVFIFSKTMYNKTIIRFGFCCLRRDFAQKAKSRWGTLVTRAILRKVLTVEIYSHTVNIEKISICLNRGREESVGNDDVSIVCARKYEMVRMT